MAFTPTPPPQPHPVTRVLHWLMMLSLTLTIPMLGYGAYRGLSDPVMSASGSMPTPAAASLPPRNAPSPSPALLSVIVVTVTPSPTPRPLPAEATAEAQKEAIRQAQQTATAIAAPKPCQPGMPDGTVCRKPTPIRVVPTSTPFIGCTYAEGGDLCEWGGAWMGVTPVSVAQP